MISFVLIRSKNDIQHRRKLLDSMLETMHWRSDDPIVSHHFENLSIGWIANGENAARNATSVVEDTGECLVALDGWLANRTALFELLGLDANTLSISDGELVRRVHARCGENFHCFLDGQFAIVVVNKVTGEAQISMDPWGSRGVVFSQVGHDFIAASLPVALLQYPSMPHDINFEYCNAWLSDLPPDSRSTFYCAVSRLNGGKYLTIDQTGAPNIVRWWNGIARSSAPSLTKRAAKREIATALEELVHAAAEKNRPTCVQVSGGLDSSTVALAASARVRCGALPPQAFVGVSLTYEGMTCDETPYIRAVRDVLPFESREVPWKPPSIERLDSIASDLAEPCPPTNYLLFFDAAAQSFARGIRVSLSGRGGDELFLLTHRILRETLWRGGLRVCWSYARDILRIARKKPKTIEWLRTLRSDLIPHWRLRPPAKPKLSPTQVGAWPLAVPIVLNRDAEQPTYAAAHAFSPRYTQSLHWYDSISRLTGLESRDPLMTRRMISVALQMPHEWFDPVAPASRWPFRMAYEGVMPNSLLLRTTKVSFEEAQLKSIQPCTELLLGTEPEAITWLEPLGTPARKGLRLKRTSAAEIGELITELATLLALFFRKR